VQRAFSELTRARRCFFPLTPRVTQLLDENQAMILTILELQNQGKLQECSQYAPSAATLHRLA
jgi:hypothetical protein